MPQITSDTSDNSSQDTGTPEEHLKNLLELLTQRVMELSQRVDVLEQKGGETPLQT